MNLVSQYNRNNFSADIENAALLDVEEKKQLENILKSEVLVASLVSFPSYDANDFLVRTNNLLNKKVQEKTHIVRLETPEKRLFAEKGLKLHKRGEVCAFCGSPISNEVYEELETYFSADEVNELKDEISGLRQEVESVELSLSNLCIISECFYPQFQEQANKLKDELKVLVSEHRDFINAIKDVLSNKMANLFDTVQGLNLEVPDNFDVIESEYTLLVKDNNSNDLGQKKIEAKEKIRLNYVKEELISFDFEVKKGQASVLEADLKQRKAEFSVEEHSCNS